MKDIAIIGGGPAGASTALHLVRKERVDPERIVILDKARFPRDKPCAGAVSQLGLDVLAAIDLVPVAPRVTMRGVRVIMGGVIGETEATMGACFRRTEFDAELLHTAAKDGVEVREGSGLRAIERSGDGWSLETTDGERLTVRVVAAADGAGSTTRKLLGLREPERKGHLYVLDSAPTAADTGVKRGLVDFDLSVLEDGVPGYYWDFPTPLDGKEAVSRGIYDANFEKQKDTSPPSGIAKGSAKDVLARSLARRGVDIAKVKLKPFSTRPYVRDSQAWLPGLLLVGEACGIDQTTGEGIAQAIEMGRIAAKHLKPALARGGRTNRTDFAAYAREVRTSTTGRHLLQSAWMARRVYGRIGKPARSFLLSSNYAREMAMSWYRGENLALPTVLRLGLGLAASLLTRR